MPAPPTSQLLASRSHNAAHTHMLHPTLQPGDSSDSPDRDLERAQALGDAILICTAIPWAVCTLLYTGTCGQAEPGAGAVGRAACCSKLL